MTAHVALERSPDNEHTGTKGEVRLVALWPFIVVVAILAIVALISEASFTPDQRIQAFQQSGLYP